MPYPDNPVKMVCSCCEGENVLKDAYSIWDIEDQDWVLFDTYDKGSFCEDCEGECSIEEVDIELPATPEPALPRSAGEALVADAEKKPDGKKTRMVTDCCESEEALRDAYAKWDVPKQEWELFNVFDAATCNDCGEECNIEEVPLIAPAPQASQPSEPSAPQP